MKYRRTKVISVGVIVVLLYACSHICNPGYALDQAGMKKLSSHAIFLTSAVEALYEAKRVQPGDSDDKILEMATKQDPAETDYFRDFTVKFKQELGHAVVLVCTKDGSQALIEDTQCIAGPDKKPGDSGEVVPCEFSIDTEYVRGACKIKE